MSSTYSLFGITVASEVHFAWAPPSSPPVTATITKHSLPLELGPWERGGVTWLCADQRVLITLTRLARFLIEGGTSITVDAAPQTTPDLVARLTLNNAFTPLLHQRGSLVLHGSAAHIGNRTYLFVGPSGSGKSALLLAALRELGGDLISDDICSLSVPPAGPPTVVTAPPVVAAWPDSLDHFKVPVTERQPIRQEVAKCLVTAPSASRQSFAVDTIVALGTSKTDASARVLTGISAFRALFSQVRGRRLAEAIQGRQLVENVAQVATRCRIVQLHRPMRTLNDLTRDLALILTLDQ